MKPVVTGFSPSRRALLAVAAGVIGELAVGFRLSGDTAVAQTAGAPTFQPNGVVRIDRGGVVTLISPYAEMGQGALMSVAMLVAEELEIEPSDVRIEHAIGDNARYVSPLLGEQITGGSLSLRGAWKPMRQAGAAARVMLVEAAAHTWSVPAAACHAEAGHVLHPASGRRVAYGALVEVASTLEVPQDPPLKTGTLRVVGKALARIDSPSKVDGSAIFGIDAYSENMLFAAIRLAPVFGTRLMSADSSKALSQPGVKRVIELEESIAVVADNYWRAKNALSLIDTTFSTSENDSISSKDIEDRFNQELAQSNGSEVKEIGDTTAAFRAASDVIEANYQVPYLAHAAMEPMNCTVHVLDKTVEVWTSTQDALGTVGRVAKIAGVPEENVVFHNSYCGGGFGRRVPLINSNMIDHATIIAKEFNVPIKTIFSREDDMQQDHYRPSVHNNFKAAFDSSNNVTAWQSRFTGPIQVPGASHIPYEIKNQSIRVVEGNTHVPLGPWRSVDHTQQTFFTESFFDEIAHRAGINPYQFRLNLLREHPRHRKVLEIAAQSAGYGRDIPDGHALGIAVQESFGSFVAQVAEVFLDKNRRPVVHKITCAIDCGWVVNPDTVEAQGESGIIMALRPRCTVKLR